MTKVCRTRHWNPKSHRVLVTAENTRSIARFLPRTVPQTKMNHEWPRDSHLAIRSFLRTQTRRPEGLNGRTPLLVTDEAWMPHPDDNLSRFGFVRGQSRFPRLTELSCRKNKAPPGVKPIMAGSIYTVSAELTRSLRWRACLAVCLDLSPMPCSSRDRNLVECLAIRSSAWL